MISIKKLVRLGVYGGAIAVFSSLAALAITRSNKDYTTDYPTLPGIERASADDASTGDYPSGDQGGDCGSGSDSCGDSDGN